VTPATGDVSLATSEAACASEVAFSCAAACSGVYAASFSCSTATSIAGPASCATAEACREDLAITIARSADGHDASAPCGPAPLLSAEAGVTPVLVEGGSAELEGPPVASCATSVEPDGRTELDETSAEPEGTLIEPEAASVEPEPTSTEPSSTLIELHTAPELPGTSAEQQRASSEVEGASSELPQKSVKQEERVPQTENAPAEPRGSSRKRNSSPSPGPRGRRRWKSQRARRLAERDRKQRVLEYDRQAKERGHSHQETAKRLGIDPRTLRRWRKEFGDGVLQPAPRGRTATESPVETRNEVIRFLDDVAGPCVGLPSLRVVFPEVHRCVLDDLLVRFRRVWKRRYRQSGFELTWHRPGAVWAIDFTEPAHPIDGVFPYVLTVRDLASHRQLAWEPVRGEAAADALPVLLRLFAEHGAPLVLKSDNGPAFVAELTEKAMVDALVTQLFSPPRRPQYNGQVERANGVLKTYTEVHAIAEGHPYRLTSEDLAHAFWLANTLSRPWGADGPSPEAALQAREPITEDERARFRAHWAAAQEEAAVDLGLDASGDLTHAEQAELDRLAISRTLQSLGYLTKERVERAKKKPKRPPRSQIQQHAALRQVTSATAAVVLHSNMTTVSPGLCGSEIFCETAPILLAESVTGGTMNVVEEANAPGRALSEAIPPAHGEPAFVSWLRRQLSPLLPPRETAMFSWV